VDREIVERIAQWAEIAVEAETEEEARELAEQMAEDDYFQADGSEIVWVDIDVDGSVDSVEADEAEVMEDEDGDEIIIEDEAPPPVRN
jgi:hypothetical protein